MLLVPTFSRIPSNLRFSGEILGPINRNGDPGAFSNSLVHEEENYVVGIVDETDETALRS